MLAKLQMDGIGRMHAVLLAVLAAVSMPAWADSPAGVGAAAYRVVIIPFRVEGGRDGTRAMVEPELAKVFEDQGYEVVHGQPVLDVLRQVLGENAFAMAGDNGFPILPASTLQTVGQRLHAKYVVAGALTIKSKRIWTITGPKAKADVYLKTSVVESDSGDVVYTEADAAGSKAKSDAQIGVALFISWPFACLMGGSRSKQEAKALRASLQKVYDPFFLKVSTLR